MLRVTRHLPVLCPSAQLQRHRTILCHSLARGQELITRVPMHVSTEWHLSKQRTRKLLVKKSFSKTAREENTPGWRRVSARPRAPRSLPPARVSEARTTEAPGPGTACGQLGARFLLYRAARVAGVASPPLLRQPQNTPFPRVLEETWLLWLEDTVVSFRRGHRLLQAAQRPPSRRVVRTLQFTVTRALPPGICVSAGAVRPSVATEACPAARKIRFRRKQ